MVEEAERLEVTDYSFQQNKLQRVAAVSQDDHQVILEKQKEVPTELVKNQAKSAQQSSDYNDLQS